MAYLLCMPGCSPSTFVILSGQSIVGDYSCKLCQQRLFSLPSLPQTLWCGYGALSEQPFLHGFEMVARLCTTYAPSDMSAMYSNFVSLIYIEMAPSDTVEHYISQICCYYTGLCHAGITLHPYVLVMIVLKGLHDGFQLLRDDFSMCLQSYADLSLELLEKRILQWSASLKVFAPSDPSLAPAACTPPPKKVSLTGTPSVLFFTHEDLL